MKILIVSDTHRSHRAYTQMIDREGKIDMLIHLGDVEGGEYYIEEIAQCPVHMVAGNNDFFSSLPREEEFYIGSKKIFITHGHYYYVSVGNARILEEARKRKADIVMFGHIHKPLQVEEDGILLLNPGSIAYPRQQGRRGTYMVMEVNEENEVKVELKYID